MAKPSSSTFPVEKQDGMHSDTSPLFCVWRQQADDNVLDGGTPFTLTDNSSAGRIALGVEAVGIPTAARFFRVEAVSANVTIRIKDDTAAPTAAAAAPDNGSLLVLKDKSEPFMLPAVKYRSISFGGGTFRLIWGW